MSEDVLLEKINNLMDKVTGLTTSIQTWIDKHEQHHEQIDRQLHSLDKRSSIYTLLAAIVSAILVVVIKDMIK